MVRVYISKEIHLIMDCFKDVTATERLLTFLSASKNLTLPAGRSVCLGNSFVSSLLISVKVNHTFSFL